MCLHVSICRILQAQGNDCGLFASICQSSPTAAEIKPDWLDRVVGLHLRIILIGDVVTYLAAA